MAKAPNRKRTGHRRKQRNSSSSSPIEQIVDFRKLILHQVVSFSTRFVQTVADLYVSRHRITLPELRVLFLLGRFTTLAPIRLAELANTDRATITRAVASLRERGLVKVAPDGEHRKRTLVRLTTAGIALHNRLARLVNRRNTWLRSRFRKSELKTLFNLLQRLERLSRILPTDHSST
jgi:DNA-binding MarR family transcriptional regulator